MTVSEATLHAAVARVPPGAWAVGVSGGADSVALLALLRHRRDLTCHAVHLDHETRAGASTADARFVRDLCDAWGVPRTIATRSDLESRATSPLPRNLSARFRALRHELFRDTRARLGLTGVLLAHHADDQAETVLQRLLRGSGPAGLTGMRRQARVGDLLILRPLLEIPALALRSFLRSIDQPWRDDESNASPAYQRNRVRHALAASPALADAARDLAAAADGLVAWARDASPVLSETFPASELAGLPDVLATEAARRWLVARGASADELSSAVLGRLIAMARDAATPPRAHFPGRLLVGRRRGAIGAVAHPTRPPSENAAGKPVG